jgi:hypothetical protein
MMKLRGMHADILLAAHGFWFDLEGKGSSPTLGAPNPFIDSGELARHLNEIKQGSRARIPSPRTTAVGPRSNGLTT